MSEHEAETMAESFPPGADDQKERAAGTPAADPDEALSRPQNSDADTGSEGTATYPGGDERAKLRGEGSDDTSRTLPE